MILRKGLIAALATLFSSLPLLQAQETAPTSPPDVRSIVTQALVSEDSLEQANLIRGLATSTDPLVTQLLTLWKEGGIFLYEAPDSKIIPVTLEGAKNADGLQAAYLVSDHKPLMDAEGKPVMLDADEVDPAETDSNLRRAFKDLTDMAALSDPDPKLRLRAVQSVAIEQNMAKLPALEVREKVETDPTIKKAIIESKALINLKSPDPAQQLAACVLLGDIGSIPSQDSLKGIAAEAEKAGNKELAAAATKALAKIASHVSTVNAVGTAFRGLSSGSVLLVVAIGLAITFGLMGVINMAHGELLVVGAYTTYVVQCIFGNGLAISPFGYSISLPGFHATGAAYSSYFILALPFSFIMAALVGLALERSVIRFLYKRPLESLLATWGVSLVLQQLFRLTFGANNVQVDSPTWLSGNWTVNDITFQWNRLFVIGFAVVIIVLTWAVLNKTSLGLLIRAVMQNRDMAACMGVRTERVNMMTFAFGSGLAGLAGAFVSQLGNVGPSLGQSYIVDSFMTVVVGGVGNLVGTVISALGIGVVDQSLQQILLNPVLGKILVLAAIILFLQWRPQGLFVTKSRSLES